MKYKAIIHLNENIQWVCVKNYSFLQNKILFMNE
ncbi:hypothetical protein SAMN05421821_10110 [Mucilaginibacter lappiensis]|uniref:Uncharacterized protein n=1 Tax=Mucilaginibacter lappiensis TaxID=354630 RepID=A0A1N6N7Q6_9SPHI|nr:hypothetical protein [Mucilaginibacter lappiensis]SIP88089.1 hypothetical protein SAMN05421821_10110 [Mucilaginibacter lappiensis]